MKAVFKTQNGDRNLESFQMANSCRVALEIGKEGKYMFVYSMSVIGVGCQVGWGLSPLVAYKIT